MITILRYLWLIVIFGGLFFVYGLKTIYSNFFEFIWLNMTIVAVVFVSIIFCFQRFNLIVWMPLVVVGSFIIGLLPYRFEIPRIKELLSNPNTELSTMSLELPRTLGVAADSLYYVGITFMLLLSAKLAVPHIEKQ